MKNKKIEIRANLTPLELERVRKQYANRFKNSIVSSPKIMEETEIERDKRLIENLKMKC